MEGALHVTAGETIYGGYDLTIPGLTAAVDVSVTSATITYNFKCSDGSSQPWTINLPDETYHVSTSDWYASGDQSSMLTYQSGPMNVPDVCGGGIIDDSRGASFSAVVTSTGSAGIHFRFHYGVKIGTSWSATISVSPYAPCTPTTPPPPPPPAPCTAAPTISCSMSPQSAIAGQGTISVSAMANDCSGAALSAVCACPAACTGCTANADGSVTIQSVASNNGLVVTCSATGANGMSAQCSETLSITQPYPTYP